MQVMRSPSKLVCNKFSVCLCVCRALDIPHAHKKGTLCMPIWQTTVKEEVTKYLIGFYAQSAECNATHQILSLFLFKSSDCILLNFN